MNSNEVNLLIQHEKTKEIEATIILFHIRALSMQAIPYTVSSPFYTHHVIYCTDHTKHIPSLFYDNTNLQFFHRNLIKCLFPLREAFEMIQNERDLIDNTDNAQQ